MDLDQKREMLREELALIKNDKVLRFTIQCLSESPDYIFENCPASSSGKYHPADELGPDGTIKHTKKCVRLAEELSRGLGCEEYRDEIIAAAILHDMLKCGPTNSGHTVKEHARLAAQMVLDTFIKGSPFGPVLEAESARVIANCCLYHYGPWTEVTIRKPMYEYTPPEMAVYMADYIVSRKWVELK